jgi:pimeloyl-ACP methyl ester carboxylesterase
MPNLTSSKTVAGADQYLTAYEATLGLWPVPHETMDVTTSFGTTHLNVAGSSDQPPIILLHGFGFSSTQWYPNIGPLSRYYRVYAPDVIDQMGRSVPIRAVRKRENYAAWLLEVFDALNIKSAPVVGHSHGGWLTLNLAIAAPRRVERMVLLSPAASFAPLAWQLYLRGMATALLPLRPVIYNTMQWLTTTPFVKGEPIIEQFVIGLRHFKPRLIGIPNVFSDEELRGICSPTLLLVGEREVIYKPGPVLERARRLIPNIEAELIAGGGHAFPLDQAQSTNKRILEFLKPPSYPLSEAKSSV